MDEGLPTEPTPAPGPTPAPPPVIGGSYKRPPGGTRPAVIATAPSAPPNQGAAIGADDQEESLPFGPTTGVGHPIPIPQKQVDWESGYQNEHGPRPSRWEAWMATPFAQGAHETIASPWGGALQRMVEEAIAEPGKTISAEQANKLYPGRPVPYTTPVDQNIAAMEYTDRQKQQELSDWAAQRPTTVMGRIASTASGFVGGMTDPLNFAIGALSGGVAELVAPEAAPLAVKAITHYLGNLGGFSATEAVHNLLEHQMGAKRKQIPEIVGESAVPALYMTGIGMALGAVARRFSNEGGGTSEADIHGIKKTVSAMEKDDRIPQLEDQRAVFAERRAGVTQPDPSGQKVKPTLSSAPMNETPLYAAAHADGAPLVHEHGLGPGAQFTDTHTLANNGVSRSSETPGQIGETKLPEGSNLLNIDQAAASDYASKDSLLKAIEEKTGVNLEQAVKNGESIKDIITQLGDHASLDTVEGRLIPDNILKQIQDIARERGFTGYEFQNEAGNARMAHVFDTAGMEIDKSYHADPRITPTFTDPSARFQGEGTEPPVEINPAMDKVQGKFYSPDIEKLVHDFRKGKTFDPYSPEQLNDTNQAIEQYKQQLTELAKTSDSAREALEEFRVDEAKDARLRDIARRIAECGQGGGI